MLVLCTGMGRSGSTWSFNVVKQLLARSSSAVRGGYTDAVGDALRLHGQAGEHVVVKTHAPDALGRALIKQRACRTIYTYREPLDSVLSAMEAFENKLDAMVDVVKDSLDLMRFQIETGGVLMVWYGDIVTRSPEVVAAIARYLELALPAEAIEDVATWLSRDNVRRIIASLGKSAAQVPGSGAQWDGGTLFSNHHVRANPSDPTQVFSTAQIVGIAARLNGYVGPDAILRPEIRALGMLDNAAPTPARWPEPGAPAAPPPAELQPVEAPAIETPPVEVLTGEVLTGEVLTGEVPTGEPPPVETPTVAAPPIEAPPVEAPSIEAASVEAPPIEAPSIETPPAEALAADAPEPVEAAPADLAPEAEPPEAISTDDAAESPAAPAPRPADAPTTLAAAAPPAPAAPKPASYDPAREAARRALARDLLRSLGRLPSGKPRLPGASR